MDLNYKNMSISEKEKCMHTKIDNTDEKFKYKIAAIPMLANLHDECERERFVSYYQMAPLIQKTLPIDFNNPLGDADYILYGHPFARVEDFTSKVLEDLECINNYKKDGAEVIIVGKATNIKPYIEGKYDNITYVDSHFTEYLGKRFEIDMKEEYFVYDDRADKGALSFWPVDGCLNKCGFCRRSYMNIPFESLSLEYIKEKLDWYKENHPEQMKEVFIRAENLTEYGLDLYGKQELAKIIDLVESYDEIKKLALPIGMCIGEITDEILDSLCRSKKLVQISLNLEAGSNRLLNLIGKKHTREQAIYIYKTLRESHPDLYIDCTIMIGLPTEGLEDIVQLADLLEKTAPDSVLCNYYGYSPKHPIAIYPQISNEVRELHLKFLIKLLKEQSSKSKAMRFYSESILDTRKRSHRKKIEEMVESQKYTSPRIISQDVRYFCGDNIVLKDEFNYEEYQKKLLIKRKK